MKQVVIYLCDVAIDICYLWSVDAPHRLERLLPPSFTLLNLLALFEVSVQRIKRKMNTTKIKLTLPLQYLRLLTLAACMSTAPLSASNTPQ